MSSFKNAFQSKSHKERGQLSSRSHLGLLEKHKDYVIRAKDFNKKRQKLKVLRAKAEFRNPDEFYYKMERTKVENGNHIKLKQGSIEHQTLQLLRTQDVKYVQHQKAVNAAKLEKMKKNLHIVEEGSKQSQHVVFVEDEEQLRKFRPEKYFNTLPEFVNRAYNRPTVEQLKNSDIKGLEDVSQLKYLEKRKLNSNLEMLSRMDRDTQLGKVTKGLELKKNLMGKGSKKKVGEDKDGCPIYKWRAERR